MKELVVPAAMFLVFVLVFWWAASSRQSDECAKRTCSDNRTPMVMCGECVCVEMAR